MLERETAQHYNKVCSGFPSFGGENPPPTRVALPSAYEQNNKAGIRYARWCSAELDLQIGMGHDLLHAIRRSTSLQNFYSRTQKTVTRGQTEMKNVARLQKRTSTEKSGIVQKYIRNWKRMQTLMDHLNLNSQEKAIRSKGLRALTETEDTSLPPSAEIDRHGNRSQTKVRFKMSWIWEVAMLERTGSASTQIADQVLHDWEEEGATQRRIHALTDSQLVKLVD